MKNKAQNRRGSSTTTANGPNGGKGGSSKTIGNQRTGASLAQLAPWQCMICDEPCEDGEKAAPSIECYNCKHWVHQTCAGVEPSLFKQLSESKSLQWVCEACQQDKSEGQSRLESKIDKMMELFSKRLEAIEREIGVDKQEQKIEEIVDRKIAEALEERDEKEKRKNNIVIVNLRESGKPTAEERQEDMSEVMKIMKICEVTIDREEITNPIRLGKIGGNRPRLLKVTITTETRKREIMKKAILANKKVSDPKKKVYVNNDLTLKERQKLQELLAEKKERMASGEKDLVIKNGKVMKKTITDNRSDTKDGRDRGTVGDSE